MSKSPWGSGGNDGPSGNGSGNRPPNIDDLANQFQDSLKKMFPGKNIPGGNKPIFLFLIIAVGLWLASGFYRVLPDEQGVVMRFGKYVTQTQPGLHYHLPYPVESVLTPKVTRVNRIDVGYRSAADTGRVSSVSDVPEESLMLTGDENIVDIDYSVFWLIKDAGKFLFNIQDPEDTVKSVAET
ncbi:MAG: protease modulator HflK, partial [Pelagibacteraceae bacterium]